MDKVNLRFKLDLEEKSKWLFISANLDIKTYLPFVQEIGDFYCLKDYFTHRKNLNSYYLSYTVSGAGVLEYENERYHVTPFQAFWIDCKKYQHYYTDPEKGVWNQVWVHFSGPSCRNYYNLFLEKNNQKNLITFSTQNRLHEKCEDLIGLYRHGNNLSKDILAASILTNMMTECILSTNIENKLLAFPDFIRNAMLFLQDHYAENLSLDKIAHACSVNKYYFHRTFKKFMGVTPNEYLITIRLNKAKELLRTTDLRVNQVASLVGIDNTSHFINTFKKHEGITPYEYSKNWYWK